MLSRRSAIILTLTSLAAMAALIAATVIIAQTWLTPTQEQRNRAAPGQDLPPAALVVTDPAPVHAEPSVDSRRLSLVLDPDCSTIGAVAGDTMAERAVDENGNIWFSTAPDIWVLNNGFCH